MIISSQNFQQKVLNRGICICVGGAWHPKHWHIFHWSILFHISIWGTWSFAWRG